MSNVQRCHILNHLANRSSNASLHLKSSIAELTYRVHVGCLFNETFMNHHRKLAHYNYSEEKRCILKILNYFKYWDECKHERRRKINLWGDKAWERSSISYITFSMLMKSVEGFLDYAHYVLDEGFAEYVPYLHSNSSVIESFFSMMRAHNADTPHGYINACGVVDVTKANDYLANNKMYEKSDETCIGNLTDVRLGHRNLHRKKVIEDNCVTDAEKTDFFTLMKKIPPRQIKFFAEIHEFLWNTKKGNYRTILFVRTKLQMYLEMFIGTEDEENIIGFMSHKQDKEHEKFNDLCQVIMTDVFLSFKKTFKGSGKVQFWDRIYLLFTNDTIQKGLCSYQNSRTEELFLGRHYFLCL